MPDMTKTPTNPRLAELARVLNNEARSSRQRTDTTIVHVDDFTTQPHPPAPAWYEPNTGDVHIHVNLAKVDPHHAQADSKKDGAVVRGLLAHELSHAKNSAWLTDLWDKKIDPLVSGILTMFEEMRVEARAINADKDSRPHLRAALPLAMGEAKEHPPTTRFDAASMWGLIYGRSLTTVISQDELRWMDDAARTVIGDDDIDYMSDLLQDAIATRADDRGVRHLIKLAEEWLEVVGRPPKAPPMGGCAHGKSEKDEGEGEKTKAAGGESGGGESGGDESEAGETANAEDGDDEDKSEADPEGGGRGKFDSEDDQTSEDDGATKEQSLSEEDSEVLVKMLEKTVSEVDANWSKSRVIMADAMAMAKTVFDKSIVNWTASKPTPAHMNYVVKTAKVLEEMVVPSISKVNVASAIPPGRLRSREAVRASAERAQGRMVTARPWEGTKRRHTSTRPIVIGIATDISGSMRWAEGAVADFAFTWANAGRRVGARTAAVTFGESAQAIVRPGEVISEVRRRSANGMNEHCDHALAALDGVLKFSHINGAAKLLVIVSDGCFVIHNEMRRVEQRLEEFQRGGTTVVWVTPDTHYVKPLTKRGLIEMVEITAGSNKAFDVIQHAVLSRLAGLSQKN